MNAVAGSPLRNNDRAVQFQDQMSALIDWAAQLPSQCSSIDPTPGDYKIVLAAITGKFKALKERMTAPIKTKLERAFELYEQHYKALGRLQMIEMFMVELEMTKAGAASYYGQARAAMVAKYAELNADLSIDFNPLMD